jgi:hypothetical protein
MSERKNVQMSLTCETVQKVKHIKEVLKFENKANVVGLAVAVLNLLVEVEKTKEGRIVLEYTDGGREELLFNLERKNHDSKNSSNNLS